MTAGILGGMAAGLISAFAIVLAGAVLATAIILWEGHKPFWNYMLVLLSGYLILGKGFAYIGIFPVYVGEIGLALAVCSLVFVPVAKRNQTIPKISVSLSLVFLLSFMLWGLARTIPYVGTYSWDALRDGVVWGYGIFAVCIAWLIPSKAINTFFRIYALILPLFLFWQPLVYVINYAVQPDIRFPGSPVSLIYNKQGDVAVHLVGAGAFILLRLDRHIKPWSGLRLWTMWTLWGIAFLIAAVTSRGGLVSVMAGMSVVLLLRPNTRWDRPVSLFLFTLVVLQLTGLSISIRQREISSQQFFENLSSIIQESSPELEGTKQWRLKWWDKIVDYTFRGDYFWQGKGYGINLADDDGFQVLSDGSLRSPHNIYMTILARSGVPGLALWVALSISIILSLARRSVIERSRNQQQSDYSLWLLAYLAAFLVNGTFDVFIESPMGGIWFWSLIGMAYTRFNSGQID